MHEASENNVTFSRSGKISILLLTMTNEGHQILPRSVHSFEKSIDFVFDD